MVMAAAARAAAQQPAPAPSTQLTLPASQERWRAPAAAAAEQASEIAREWLGPHPSPLSAGIAIDPPVWQGRGAMVVEGQAAHAVIRSWWPSPLSDDRAAAMLDGFAWYLQGHAVERLFDRRYLRQAYAVASVPMFGEQVYWSIPTLRLSRWSAGIRRHAQEPGLATRYAAMFATLERWIGAPALQSAMFEVARLPADRLTGPAIATVINDATGHDLSWLFTAVGDERVIFDYAVSALASAPATGCPAPCFDSEVTVMRAGNGQFSGSSAARAGDFDAGDALVLRVSFVNGETAFARWDGRDPSRTFRFQGPSPAVSAHLDPDRVVLLDVNYLNNAKVAPVPTNAPVGKWMARWMVWMQNTMLSYGLFA
jgi:hypothetical protein